jgi:CheY-like chemotaxis protein
LLADNPGDVLLFRNALAEYSDLTQFRIAADGEQAIQILTVSDFKADLIVTDVNLPKLSGFSLLEQIPERCGRWCSHPPQIRRTVSDR